MARNPCPEAGRGECQLPPMSTDLRDLQVLADVVWMPAVLVGRGQRLEKDRTEQFLWQAEHGGQAIAEGRQRMVDLFLRCAKQLLMLISVYT
jgi:hypothetical protein